jgi:hypothetical protein
VSPPAATPSKRSAVLDRRLTTEMTVFLARNMADASTPYLPSLLTSCVDAYGELLIESTHSSTLQQLVHEANRSLGDVLLFVSPPSRSDDWQLVLDDAADAWALDPELQLIAGRYERGKGGRSSSAKAIEYVQHVLDLARVFDAAIVPHPDRWPLFRYLMEHCIWPAAPVTATHIATRPDRQIVFGTKSGLPSMLVRYDAMPFPFPSALLRHYAEKALMEFATSSWEFLVVQTEKPPAVESSAVAVRGIEPPSTEKIFDVFISYNGRNRVEVVALAEALRARGLSVWLDVWELAPGRTWMNELERIIATCRSALVCVGAGGMGPWEEPEMQGLLRRFVRAKQTGESVQIIPVLLPGAPLEAKLPLFLEAFTWVDLRDGLTAEEVGRLEWGITGRKAST